MSSLFATLGATSGTLKAYEAALNVAQNNIGNSSTPDYAAQQVQFDSLAFDPSNHLIGGESGITVTDTRSSYADQSVRSEISKLGTASQQSTLLTGVQSLFDVTGQTGVSGSLNSFFSSFSALSVNPSDPTALQNVINQAQQVAQSFQQAASSLSQTTTTLNSQISSQVNQINSLASQIQQYNVQRQQSGQADPNLSAKVETAVESLSQIANISTTTASDGTTSVLLDGQTPLVLGLQQFQIQSGPAPSAASATNPAGTPGVRILDSNGVDITSQITQGQLAGSLQVRNTVLPALQGDQSQQGSINQLAQAFADRVNTLLTSGNISDGPPAQTGVPLFTYDTTNPANVAQSLSVSTTITPDQIATIDPGPPEVGNGIALKIAGLAQGTNPADQIAGASFTSYFGQIASSIGSQLQTATANNDLYTQSVAQAQNLQTQLSGVSLDTEATNLIQFQKGYDATAKLVTILDQITQSAIDMLQ